VLVAHACNPSYSVCRDQEDCSLKPAEASNLQKPIMKKPFTKKGLMEWLMVLMYRPWLQVPVLPKNSFLHFSDYGEGHKCREKEHDDQVMEWMFGDQNHGNYSIRNSVLCCLTHPDVYIMHALWWVSHLSMYFFHTGAWTQGLYLEPPHQPIVCVCVRCFFLRWESHKLFSQLYLNCDPPDICLLSS
jgi:hypothetical protein